MKRAALHTSFAGLVGAAVLASLAPFEIRGAQDDAPTELEPRVEALEAKLESMVQSVEHLTQKNAQLERFFAAQSRQASALRTSLADAEKNGFTAGINPKSREVLLAGFRGYVDGLEAALPATKSEKTDAPAKKDEKAPSAR
ncbi:hypothetical protein Pla163_18380 [Planctomycetes bacterium Pla163]|uniref:Uncharacterized protein n=1 Tax=Rohdeia mirabilis TaxID=2528008 RepID=A0A518CZR8_9BACT|nr:hypothetical protein Pla163_18380 [Planctomycetes bacterium Pla163]